MGDWDGVAEATQGRQKGETGMRLWDAKDSAIIAQAIKAVAPNDADQCADLIVDAAWRVGINWGTLYDALERAMKAERKGQ